MIPGDCHMLDSATHEGNVVAALLLQDNSYHFHHISQDGIHSHFTILKGVFVVTFPYS